MTCIIQYINNVGGAGFGYFFFRNGKSEKYSKANFLILKREKIYLWNP